MPRGHVLPDGASVAALRGEAGLTQDELAERAGYGLRTIGNVEGGRRTTAATLTAVATVLSTCLGRPVHLSDLLVRRREEPGDSDGVIIQQNIKLLELPAIRSGVDKMRSHTASTAVLTDTIYIRQVPANAGELLFYYPAAAIDGRSLSHKRHAEWISTVSRRVNGVNGDAHVPQNLLRALRLEVSAAPREGMVVQNQVEFASSFDRSHEKMLQSHVAYTTDSLTMLVRFPEQEPFRTLHGMWRQRDGGPLLPTADKPLDIAGGSLAYWHISAPRSGATYQLNWT
jgi:transcriptional regulator with XRE-family HTH domain